MMREKVFGLAAMVVVVISFANMALAGRPLNTNDTEPVETGVWQVEASAAYQHDSGCDHFDFPFTLATGIFSGFDIGVGLGGRFEERTEVVDGTECRESESGLGDLAVSPRWKYFDQARFLPSQAVSFTVKFPTADREKGLGSGETDYDLTWIATERINEKVQVDANLGFSWIGKPEDENASDLFHHGLALEVQLLESVQWVGEVFGEKELTSGGETVWLYSSGFRWAALPNLTLDAAAGSGSSGEAPDLMATAGLTWTFGPEKDESN